MKSNIILLKSISKQIGTLVFGVIILINLCIDPILLKEDIMNILGLSVVISSIIVFLLDRIFWKKILNVLSTKKWIWIFFEQYECPILCEEYQCLIKYDWPEGTSGEKATTMKITQTYTSVTIKMDTDEMKSRTLISEVVKENEEFVLYYTYNTNPKAQYLESNSRQYGGGRIVLDSITDKDANQKLEGIYWTTSKTKGDLYLNKI